MIFSQMVDDPSALPEEIPSRKTRPAEQVAPEPIGCLLVKRQGCDELLWRAGR